MSKAARLTTVTSATEMVSPATARNWLTNNNIGNRKIRWGHVSDLRSRFMSGQYTQTSQGIGFDVDGVLQNGQHRLLALSEMPSGTRLPFTIIRGLPKASYWNEDTGITRTVADALKIDAKLSQVLTLGAVIAGVAQIRGRIRAHETAPYVEFFQEPHENVTNTFPGNLRTWGSAPIRAAACFAIRSGERQDYVLSQYKALCTGRLKEASAATEAINVAFRKGIPSDKLDALVRACKAFKEENSEMRVIKLGANEREEVLADLKKLIEDFNR